MSRRLRRCGTATAGGGGGEGTTVFDSDWASVTAPSTTLADIKDSAKAVPWVTVSLNNVPPLLEIVSTSGLGFPAALTRCLRVGILEQNPANAGVFQIQVSGLAVPSASTNYNCRCYMRIDIEDGVGDSATHPVQDGLSAGTHNWAWYVRHNDAGNGLWVPRLFFGPSGLLQYDGPTLTKGVPYRFETQLCRLDATTFTAGAWIHEAVSGDLVAETEDFEDAGQNPLSEAGPITFTNVARLAELNAACNGIDSTVTGNHNYGYQAGFKIVHGLPTNTLIGAAA